MDGVKRVAQACNACKLRKVKCNGQQRCQQCNHLDLRCVYTVKQKQRTSFKRGRLISQYKQQTSSGARYPNLPSELVPATRPPEGFSPIAPAKSAASSLTSPVTTTSDSTLPASPGEVRLDAEPSNCKDRALAWCNAFFDVWSAEDMMRVLKQPRRRTMQSLNVLPENLSTGVEAGEGGPLSSRWLCGHSAFGRRYDASFFLDLLPYYRCNVFPFSPIITEREIQESVSSMHADREHRSLVYAFAAVTMSSTKMCPMHAPGVLDQMFYLSSRSAELRGAFMLNSELTIKPIMISMFLHNCLMTLRKYDTAFFYLQEAITMILMLRMDDAATMSKLDVQERARRQRLYWAAFIHERVLAIVDHRQVVLSPLGSGTPEFDPNLPPDVHEEFAEIIKLFSLVDDECLRNRLSRHYQLPEPSPRFGSSGSTASSRVGA